MAIKSKVAFLFPGQGAQYIGMGKDFADTYAIAKETFQEGDDILERRLSKIAFEGPEDILTETRNSQTAIFINSIAILRVLKQLFPGLDPVVCSGLSLGEYSALVAAGNLSFQSCLPIVQYRGQYMNEACEETRGTMAVVMGMSPDEVETVVRDLKMPRDLWVANYNCPGQIVISGTLKGVEAGSAALKEKGAKRVLPLQVYGAFHSGLMQSASDKLAVHVDQAPIVNGKVDIVQNVPGDYVKDVAQMKQNLIKQVIAPVRWEQGVRAMQREGVELYVEIGCGKTLAGMNKRIGVMASTVSIDKVEDLRQLEAQVAALQA